MGPVPEADPPAAAQVPGAEQDPTFDPVHDVQAAYRLALRALAYPGTVVDLAPLAARLRLHGSMNPAAVVLAHTLLDAQTDFAILSPTAEADGRLLRQLSGARPVEPHAAAYLFVLGGADPGPAIAEARIGTLEDPHLGATVIVEVEGIGDEGHDSAPLRLRGPGIATEARLAVDASFDWLSAREASVREFPLGIDLFLLDRRQRLAALPRTTRVQAAPAAEVG